MKREDLIKFGMVEQDDPIILLAKELGRNEDDDKLSLVVTRERNRPEIALTTPDGVLFLNIETIAELEAFERFILEYESNY